MANRSNKLCDQFAPLAPPGNSCSQIVQPLATNEIRMKGPSLERLRHCQRPLRHQRQSASTNGNITVEGLLATAIAKNSKEKPKLRLLSFVQAIDERASSPFRKNRIDNRKKKHDCVFFNSVIHATDCTITGCKAQSAAPNQAP